MVKITQAGLGSAVCAATAACLETGGYQRPHLRRAVQLAQRSPVIAPARASTNAEGIGTIIACS